MACQIVGFRPLGTLSAEPHRFYTQFVMYRQFGDTANNDAMVIPVRLTEHCDIAESKALDMRKLFAGHCAWIARDIAEREARQAKRYNAPILKAA